MDFWQTFWGAVWFFFSALILVVYIVLIFRIISDLLRDRTLAGGWKVLWILGLLFFPVITALLYLLVRGRGMNIRAEEDARAAAAATRSYIRDAAASPADEIQKAKTLLDEGTITADEFAAIKARALAA